MKDKKKTLGEAELDIMQAVWEGDEAMTSGAILKRLYEQRDWKLPTLMTSLSRLCDKGFLTCDKSSGTNLYSAAVGEEDYKAEAGKTFLQKVYGSSICNMVATLYGGRRLTEGDIRELKDFLDGLEKDK